MRIMKKLTVVVLMLFCVLSGCNGRQDAEDEMLAAAPPMGWNSWICFGTSVTEDEVKANADYMSANLREYGWEYVVIDAGWYAPGMVTLEQYESPCPEQLIDAYGRLVPDPEKYPSSAGGKGLAPLADYVHGIGLKIGLHIMRGIPVQAVEMDTPVKGTVYTARDIADINSRCDWYSGFYGIDMSRPGAQEYYDSIFELYESWGIDYIKADDMLSPVYASDEIGAVASAVSRMGRKVVISLSPGPAPVENIADLRRSAQMWRISEDFWDSWDSLKEQFSLCRKWQGYAVRGHWPDADMLPVGPMARRAMRGGPRPTNFTEAEQYTLMTLWAMFRSPLMIGCNLPELDDFTLKLLTNGKVLEINQNSVCNKELFARGDIIAWYAGSANGESHYVAVFNTGDSDAEDFCFALDEINFTGDAEITELWSGEEVNVKDRAISCGIDAHGVKLFEINLKDRK